ncbi:Non-ribosomal peptide synthetase NPS4 [Bipolaris sorokiniana ND90Pr]|uniref:Nonribosomal peptide synthetase 6 n=1 Tax=Cochliobolus sativus (strain ND90Pr / ATCC 201652) TaxID=665912 RepID=M2T9V4_COCSN|nr:Non-ribosomal peptide synthetase NPS4 [Bipolaris sorokiniana ND90Pr]EMD66011.1 Non-ribosomal peptide synthetase NPS4 [Bipolaris sorokiniana ND90Pr]
MERQDISGHLSGSEVLPRLDDAFDPTVSQRQVMTMHKYTPESIIDIYPCTPLQEDLMFLSLARPGTYIDRYLIYLHEGLSAERWIHSWQKVVAETPILRTKIIQRNEKEPLLQVVTSKVPDVPLVDQLDFYLSADQETPMGFGQPLHRIVRISNSKSSRACFVWTLHHAIYDGWSMDIILRGIQQTFTVGTVLQPAESFRHFIEYTAALDAVQSQNYWSNYLADTEPAFFPAPSAGLDGDVTRRSVSRNINMNKYGEFTLATYVKASWGILLASYNHTEDIVFACTVSGRDCPLVKIENIVGPTINVVPIRLDTRGSKKISELLYNVQRDAASSIPHQTLGLRNIQKLSSELRHVCDFNSLLIIQPKTITDFQDRKDIMELQPLNESSESVQYSLLLEVCQTADGLTVHLGFSTEVISKTQAYRIIGQFEHILAQLTIDQNQTLSSVGLLSSKDCANLVLYSKFRANLDESCIHLEINDQVNARPEALAVHSWDGDFSYKELSQASCQMAKVLLRNGLQAEQVVLLCFEKSKWTIVAALGVLMAGGTFCLLDIRDPSQRHHVIANITKAKIALTSPGFAGRLQGIVETILSVDARNLSKYDTNLPERPLPDVKAQQAAYIMFTSGSTGTPKGVAIEHRNFCYNSEQQRRVWNITNDTRFLQFASYSFTVSLIEIFTTLIGGGCVCVPSESERMEDLPSAVARLRATHACFTSSVLRTINPIEFPSLEFVMTSGEVVLQDDIRRWCDFVRLYQGYGQAECSPIVASTEMLTRESLPNCIGKPIGGRCWIVLPQDQNRLAPLGAIGELVVEGLHVGREYVNNPGKTREVFINHRRWTGEDIANKQGGWPMYRTGDLVRYGADGLLYYHGRKDFQVKVNGQRIELGEIESHLLQILDSSLDCAVDSIFVDSDGQRSMKLAAFVSIRDSRRNNGNPTDVGQNQREIIDRACQSASRDLKKLFTAATELLYSELPGYMVPTVFLPIYELPLTVSGKLNRKKLREKGTELLQIQRQQEKAPAITEEPYSSLTEAEQTLRTLWGDVLQMRPETISAADHFLRLGGDSIAAMRLSSLALEHGISLLVSDVFSKPVLREMASVAKRVGKEPIEKISPFAILPDGSIVGSLLSEAFSKYGIKPTDVQDMYPCSPLQEGIMSLSTKLSGSYIIKISLDLRPNVDLPKFLKALHIVRRNHAILRTRICVLESSGKETMLQLVLSENDSFTVLERELERDEVASKAPSMSFGTPLSQFVLKKSTGCNLHRLDWFLHHTIYDAWSLRILLRSLRKAYHGLSESVITFNNFIRYIEDAERQEQDNDFWRKTLMGAERTPFPPVTTTNLETKASSSIEMTIELGKLTSSDVTISSILYLSWATVVGRYCDAEDVVLGVVLSGRSLPIPGIESISGPTFTTLPLRVNVSQEKQPSKLLIDVQDMSNKMIGHQHCGLHHIQALGEDIRNACTFNSLIFTEPPDPQESDSTESIFEQEFFVDSFVHPHPLLLSCKILRSGNILVTASYADSVLNETQTRRILAQFSHVCKQFFQVANGDNGISEISIASPEDYSEIVQWNSVRNAEARSCIHTLICNWADKHPYNRAIEAPDGTLSYEELNRYSDRLAQHLVSLDVQFEDVILICFEKTVWVPVAILATLKVGATFVMVGPCDSLVHRSFMASKTKAKMGITSKRCVGMLSMVDTVIVLHESTFTDLPEDGLFGRIVDPSSAAYIVFTSGSTGEPKGCVVEHANVSSSLKAFIKCSGLGPGTRGFQFAPHSSGTFLVETLGVLIAGGCLCIPSETDLGSNVEDTMNQLQVTWAIFIPSMLMGINPNRIKTLQGLAAIGEPLPKEVVISWNELVDLRSVYGQSETAEVMACSAPLHLGMNWRSIGRLKVGCGWIVEPHNHNQLAPVGCVGELIVEGPHIGRGYLDEQSIATNDFIYDPSWSKNIPRRDSNHYISRRFYKTSDLVRYDAEGNLEFVSRKGDRFMLNGQHIDLNEVQYRLREAVNEPITISVKLCELEPGKHRSTALIAFLSTNQAMSRNEELRITELLTGIEGKLAEDLPRIMIPSRYLLLEQLPKTPSGKLNYRQLEQIAAERRDTAVTNDWLQREITGELGIKLRAIWSTVLNVPEARIFEDTAFQSLGGDSISAIQVVSKCRAEGISISVNLLLQHKSISKLSKMVQDQDHGYYEEDSEEDDDLDLPFPLLPIQQFHFETVPLGENCFNLSHLLEVRVGVSENALREALDVLVQRHPALTTRFIQAGARWFQVISSEKNNPYLFHYREVAAMGDVTEICKLLQTQLDIRNGPLFAAGYFVIKSRQFLFLTIHHLVVDFVSLRILLGELESSLSGGVASSLRSLSVQKWSALLRAKTESDQEVKKEILSAFPKTNLKFWNMQHRPKLRGDMSVHTFELAEHVSSAILSQCEPLEAEPVELFLAATTFAFKNIFFEREGPNVYLEGHGREVWSPRIDITSTVGWFAAFMPVNSPPGRRVSFLEELDCVRSTHRKREDHGTLDFASLFSLEGRYEERSSYQNMEIAFIYAGLNQHLERENSLFKEVEGCEEIGLAGFAGKLPWFSLMDVIVSITDGKIRFDIFWNKHMNHQTRLEQWAAETASVLRRIPEASIYSGPTAAVAEFQ